MALSVLLSALSHAGHIRFGPSVHVVFEFVSLLVEKLIVRRVLSESGCVSFAEEAGHIGLSFRDFDEA